MRTTMNRKRRRLLSRSAILHRARDTVARAVVNPTSPFSTQVKPSAKIYRRRPKRPARAFAEHYG